MKRIFRITSFLVLLHFFSCSTKIRDVISIQNIDIEENINMFTRIYLSQFTNNVVYIPLETEDSPKLGNVFVSDISDSLLLVTGDCILYDFKGRYIKKIGNRGSGPEEYRFYSNGYFGYNKNIFFQDLYDLMEFRLDGSFIGRYKNTFFKSNEYNIECWHPLNDSLFFGYIGNNSGRQKYKAIIFDKFGEIKFTFINYELFDLKSKFMGGYSARANFYHYNNNMFFKAIYNDTLFYLSDNYDLTPQYVFNLGKFKEPASVRGVKPFSNYIYIDNVFQTRDYLFLKCEFGDIYPAKRLTPLIIAPGIRPTWYNTRFVLGIYKFNTEKLVFSTPTSTDNPLYTTGLYNDIDAGPRFLPQLMVNDSTMVMCISSKRFLDHISSNDFRNIEPKYPEKKIELEKLSNSLKETDNPVLMIVRLKK